MPPAAITVCKFSLSFPLLALSCAPQFLIAEVRGGHMPMGAKKRWPSSSPPLNDSNSRIGVPYIMRLARHSTVPTGRVLHRKSALCDYDPVARGGVIFPPPLPGLLCSSGGGGRGGRLECRLHKVSLVHTSGRLELYLAGTEAADLAAPKRFRRSSARRAGRSSGLETR